MKTLLLALALVLSAVAGGWAEAGEAAEQPPPPPAPSELKLALDVMIVTAVSVEGLKRTFKDPRPVGSGYAFPSGHATLAFALARVASEYHPEARTLWYLLAARVAWLRVKRRAHDWDDVIAGAALGSWIGDTAVGRGGIVLGTVEW